MARKDVKRSNTVKNEKTVVEEKNNEEQKSTKPVKEGWSLEKTIDAYLDQASSKTLLIDGFMLFTLLVGILQFLFVLLVGSYPFNAFLGGFSCAVGQFVLLASLRMSTSGPVKNERQFADFIFASLLLHFFVYSFIN